jgi:hypothetical protein
MQTRTLVSFRFIVVYAVEASARILYSNFLCCCGRVQTFRKTHLHGVLKKDGHNSEGIM